MTTDAIAAGTACVWKTSRAGASFVCVSMIANRIRTLIAADVDDAPGRPPRAARRGSRRCPASAPKQTIIARPQRMMSRIVTTSSAAPIMTAAKIKKRASSQSWPRSTSMIAAMP